MNAARQHPQLGFVLIFWISCSAKQCKSCCSGRISHTHIPCVLYIYNHSILNYIIIYMYMLIWRIDYHCDIIYIHINSNIGQCSIICIIQYICMYQNWVTLGWPILKMIRPSAVPFIPRKFHRTSRWNTPCIPTFRSVDILRYQVYHIWYMWFTFV